MSLMQQQPRLLDVVTPVSPFKSSTKLLASSNNNNCLSTRCLLIQAGVHLMIAITLIILYIQAMVKDFFYANLLCYNQDNNTGDITPCNTNDTEVSTVYNASILNIITDSWESANYHISIILFFISFIFPFIHILNNLRITFKRNTSIKIKKNSRSIKISSILCEALNKLSMMYLFGCILCINGLYQSTATDITEPSPSTLYQRIVIEADIAANILIVAVIISSIWSVYVQFGVNKHPLFGHHRYIFHENNSVQLILVGFFIIIAGILVIITYFMRIDFIHFDNDDIWSGYNGYNTTFDDVERKYNFFSLIEDVGDNNDKDNNKMLIGFYYLYVFIIPTLSYIGCIVLSLILKYYQYQIKQVLLLALFYLFLCFNGLDMLLITSIVSKYLLPSIWDSIIDSIYAEFCDEFIIVGHVEVCDDLTVDIMLKDAMWIGAIFIFILLVIFCLMNDWKCSKHIYNRYKYQSESRYKTDTWDYGNTAGIRQHKESTHGTIYDNTYNATTESEVDLSRIIAPYSSTSNAE